MKKIDKLILKSFFSPFLLTFIVAVFILLTIFMLKYFDDFVGKDVGFLTFAELIFYFSINVTPPALPLAILLSSLMTYGRLGEHFELTAIKSAGISLLRTLRPIFIFTCVICVIAFYNSNWFVPKANLDAYSLLYDIKQKKPAMDLSEGQFYSGLPGFSIKVNKKFPDGISLKEVMIYDHTTGDGNMTVILADSSRMYSFHDDRYLMFELYNGTYYNEMKDRSKARKKVHAMERTSFNSMKIAFSLASFNMNRTDKELFSNSRLMKSLPMLQVHLDSMILEYDYVKYRIYSMSKSTRPYGVSNQLEIPDVIKKATDFKKVLLSPTAVKDTIERNFKENLVKARSPIGRRYLGIPEKLDSLQLDSLHIASDSMVVLSDLKLAFLKMDSVYATHKARKRLYGNLVSDVRRKKTNITNSLQNNSGLYTQIRKHRFEEHKRYAQSITCLIMFLIGAPLGSIIKKGGLGFPVIVSILFFVVFYVLSNTGYKLSRSAQMDDVLAAWLPNMILLPFGVFFLRQARIDARLFDPDIYLIAMEKIKMWWKKRFPGKQKANSAKK